MGKKYTKKETDFLGNEKEVHYEDGKKVGETKYRETFWGNKVQDHYDASGDKIGETGKQEGLFGDKAFHYDADKDRIGFTKDDETLLGNKIQRHYDKSGNPVGKSHYEDGIFSGRKKVHDGEYFKGKKDEGSSGGGGGGSIGSFGDLILGFLGRVVLGAMCVGLTFGAIWVNEHTTQFSFLWWLSLVVALVSGFFTIQILLGLAIVLGIIALIIWLIGYFLDHPW